MNALQWREWLREQGGTFVERGVETPAGRCFIVAVDVPGLPFQPTATYRTPDLADHALTDAIARAKRALEAQEVTR